MPMPPVPQQMSGQGKLMGARQPPSMLSLCTHGPCAISGYENGDPLDGSMTGAACTACILYIIFCPCASIYAAFVWKPDPEKIQNDGTMRTLNNKCCAVICLSGPCTISFWNYGDICGSTGQGGSFCCDLCSGEAGISCALNVIFEIIGLGPIGDFYACCCWQPNPATFRRTDQMHGGRDPKPGEAVSGAVGAAVAAVVGVVTGNAA